MLEIQKREKLEEIKWHAEKGTKRGRLKLETMLVSNKICDDPRNPTVP